MKIFEALRQDHEKQRLLLKILAETSGNTAARREYYEALKTQLESHAIAEERHFYTHLLEKDATVDLTRHGIAEHHEIDELLGKLDETDMSSPAWLRHLKTLQEKVEHHLADEEQEFFQVAGNVLNDSQKTKLADAYREEMKKELDEEKVTA
ncbi:MULTISPECIES: hemerythrin domain-containing protein [Alteromonas]|uniref:hemerythrin domain-containing protein n=1 Tax=Alteromonas TaxID=226 RepID=UPI001131931F|nr:MULTISPECIES: hemerythrin domain-containing protein [Alteromonas]MEA3382363.1 hemerythrin domain-containing protein [Pseudomonadota bacterium]NQY16903.1 hemerythrin domain-containing protein [Alteromonas sp.]QDG38417.1 hemerythrin domain-containing protein [Alteromonas mediterranea]QGX61768.1 hemerythrin domain-containing protein [Alteromonas mediterranea]|tara:strand:+ start:1404 stop:1859 length:456 start_codon:yes stop_codon:yes gene_type:complete